MELVDIGVNLAHKRFTEDVGPVLERARAQGVGRLVITGVNLEVSEQAHRLCGGYPGLWSTAGVHPHYARDFTAETLLGLRALCRRPAVVAVGECGLDFNRNFSTPEDQQRACEAQLELAAEVGKPVFLHQRDAHEALMALIRPRRAGLCGGVVHCFTGNAQELDDCLALDLHIGITGWICDERRGLHLRELVARIPENRLMVETDAPFLLPRSIRPKPKSSRNEPMYLGHVVRAVAEARGQTPEAVAAATSATAEAFFGLA